MATQPLELRIERKGRKQTVLEVEADPADTEALRRYLIGWLEGEKWDPGLWGQFELIAFPAGAWKRVARVRP